MPSFPVEPRALNGSEIQAAGEVESAESIPLSFEQERLWFVCQLEPESPLYNVPVAVRLSGELRIELLEDALNQLLVRHDALRTNFLAIDGAPVQQIRTGSKLKLSMVDLSRPAQDLGHGRKNELDGQLGSRNGSQPSALERLLGQEARRPFALANDLLIRAVLYRLGECEHVLLLNLHHLVCDEWSVHVLLNELGILYNGGCSGKKTSLSELPIQYADYAVWKREWLETEAWDRHLDYWKERLEGEIPRFDWPARTAPERLSSGARERLDLPDELTKSLLELSRSEGVTLFTLLLAAFKSLLHRCTGQDDLLVGSPIAGRTRVETEGVVGFFVNMLVLRTRLSGDPAFREALRRVRETFLGASEHQDLPFEKLVEVIHPERSSKEMPFLQAVFALERTPEAQLSLHGLEIEPLEVETGTAKFELTWVVRQRGARLSLCAEYATGVFEPWAIRQMLRQWETLLHGIVADPAQPISAIPLLRPEERQQLLVKWNSDSSRSPVESGLVERFAAQVRRNPQAVAVRYGNAALTYGELDARTNQLASLLGRFGVGPEQPVALCAEPSLDFVVGMLGIIKAGCAYVPLDPASPRQRLSKIIEQTQTPIVLCQERHRTMLASTTARPMSLEALPPEGPRHCSASSNPGQLAYVMYTSGSTGTPKGVLVEQGAIVRLVCDTDYVQLQAGDRVAQASNVCFDAATFEIWGALLNGATLVGIGRDVLLSPRELAAQLEREGITTLFLTTALFNQLAAEEPAAFKGLKNLLFGGETVDPASVRRVLKYGPPARLLHVYGPTETTTFATWHLVSEIRPEATTVPIGHPISGWRAYLLDERLEPVPAGMRGQIYIGGAGVARGYLDQAELTAERFIPDPFSSEAGARLYRTGDLGRYRPDGAIEFLGRRDNQVKIRGFRIEPAEVEAAIMKHPAVKETVVVADGEDSASKRLIAYVVPRKDSSAKALKGLRDFLRENLPSYMVPARVVPLERLPLNENGKIQRGALPAPEPVLFNSQESTHPATALEEQLAGIWGEVLGVHGVGVDDDFFELGGHSLLAVRLFSRIETRLGVKLPLATLFQSPTVRQLASVISKGQELSSWPLLVEIQGGGSRPPIFWVHSLGGDGGGAFFYYRKLAQLLGPEQPSFGIRSPQQPFTDIHEMAARYVAELTASHPRGPYFLGGFCFGGIVAFEMARQLQAHGQEVGLVALLESVPPGNNRVQFGRQAATAFAGNVRCWLSDLARTTPGELWGRLERKGAALTKKLSRLLSRAAPKETAPGLADLIDMAEYPKDYVRFAQAHWQALLNYRPAPYPGRVTLFRARKQPLLCLDPTLGWSRLAQGGVALNVIPGTHEKMLEEPNVQILAAELKAYLAEAQAECEVNAPEPLAPVERGQKAAASWNCSIVT